MLGQQLALALGRDGCRVFSCGRGSKDDVRLDLEIADSLAVPGDVKAEVLFHCAAAFGGDDWQGAWVNEKVNALGCHQVAKLAHAVGCKHVVYAGTIFSISEGGVPESMSSYGASKLRGEEILRWRLGRMGIRFTSLRFSQLYDSRGLSCRNQPWLRRIFAYANAGEDMRMPEYSAKRNFLHVVDAAELMLAFVRKGLWGVYPAAHPVSYTYEEVARIAYARFGNGGRVVLAREKQAFRNIPIPDSGSTFMACGVSPAIDLETGVGFVYKNRVRYPFGLLDIE